MLSDSLWHLPVYTAHPAAGPAFLFYRYNLELDGIPLRFVHDPSLFHSTPFMISGRGFSLRYPETARPLTTAYSEQAGAWGLSRFGAMFARGLGDSGRLLGTFDYNEFGVLTEQVVGHQGLLGAFGSLIGIGLDGLVLSAGRDSLSYLHIRSGVGFGPARFRAWKTSFGRYGSSGLSGAVSARDFSLALSREELSWDGEFAGLWLPRLSWSRGNFGAWAGWLFADSGQGPVLGARASGSSGSVEIGYRTDIPDPAFMPGLHRTLSEAYLSGEICGYGLSARADASWGDWFYGYSGDSGGIKGLGRGVRLAGGLSGNRAFGPLLTGFSGHAAWFSSPSPEQFYWQTRGLLGLRLSLLRGDLLVVPSLSGHYYGEPFSALWSSARLDLTFYRAARAYASLENLGNDTLHFFGQTWRGRVWRFGASVLLWD